MPRRTPRRSIAPARAPAAGPGVLRLAVFGLIAAGLTVVGPAGAGVGCAPGPVHLRPALGAGEPTADGDGVRVQAGALRVEARVEAWRGEPVDLAEDVLPILVAVENRGSAPILLRHADFRLVSGAGAEWAALPPSAVRETVAGRVKGEVDAAEGFQPEPHVAAWYPGGLSFQAPYVPGPYLYDPEPARAAIELATADVGYMALPEKALAPAERVSGFVYFPHPAGDPRQLTLQATFVAEDGAPVATVAIPFEVARR